MLTKTESSRAALHVTALAYHAEPGLTPLSDEKTAVLARVPPGAHVLEVGAHTGYFSAQLRARGCTVTALEVDPRAAPHASRFADRVVVGDVEDPHVRAKLDGPFDVVLFMHVLEHLVDPWTTLGAMREMLAPGGLAIVLLPNVACWQVRKTLFFRGTFEYEETGILDRTHLRFFTLGSGRGLLEASGYVVRAWTPTGVCVPLERRISRVPILRALAPVWHRWWLAWFPNLCTEIVLYEAVPRGKA
ncbi:MAG TPA: class I SAM-dependent methyltransferase [Candidatus Eisenbacteria bacterium]|nr:class I SAM-dependent methyltransferase [Candidatus Eisenbacteria bacterium]